MRVKKYLNDDWQFHAGELKVPFKTAKKAHALGGLTAALPAESEHRILPSAGGVHFLKLIAQGNVEMGLRNLAGTDLTSHLDSSWQTVTLPHDWKVAQPFVNNPANLMSGSKADGVGYYRRVFELPTELFKSHRLILHFDGVMRMADIWLNGAYLAHNNSGYTAIDLDITEMANYGDEGPNVLLVRADTTTGPEGWWYEGAGIYRSVWLEQVPYVSLNEKSLYVYTKSLAESSADLGIECSVENHTDNPQVVQPTVEINEEKISLEKVTIPAHEQHLYRANYSLKNPMLWTPETPNLYTARFKITDDLVQKEFGVHTFKYNENGFYLNGNRYELHGICEHQDFGGVGVALDQDIVSYKVSQMKRMGVNAWRSAHHFASEELLTACDRLGMLVINENRLLESTPWRVNDLEKMVMASRMHASIGFWSVANEELIGNTALGERVAKKLVQTIKKCDYEHLVMSAELLNPEGTVDEDYLKNFDVLGVNYPEAGVMGAGAELIKQNHPHLPMMSTENASYFSTRGVYKDDAEKCQCNNFGSMYSMVLPGKRKAGDPGVGGTAHPETVMDYFRQHSYMGGVFLWTAFDYYGEPSPFEWPGIGSQFGICDNCGFPKDYYYYYQAHWTSDDMIHVMPAWKRDALELDSDGKVAVRAFSNAQYAELFVNGISYGRKALDDCEVNWRVPYADGELKVCADNGGEVVASDCRHTSDIAKKVNVSSVYRGVQDTLYEISAVDQNGYLAIDSNDPVDLSIQDGTISGTGNGNPANIETPVLNQVRLFNGRALVIVRRVGSQVELTAKLKTARHG